MIVEIDPNHPEPRKIQRAVDALESGEVIAYPTDTVYGLGCDLTNKKALDKLYAIKQMEKSHPLAFICPDLRDIAHYALVENATYRILRHWLPGPYCFILLASREVPKLVQTKRKTVGIRIPAHAIPHALTVGLGRPILSTTAASRDGEVFIDSRDITDAFPGLALVIDGGAGGLVPTSVVDLTGPTPVVVREGAGAVDDFLT